LELIAELPETAAPALILKPVTASFMALFSPEKA